MLITLLFPLLQLHLCGVVAPGELADPAVLRSLMASARSDLISLDATVQVTRFDTDIARQFPPQTWRVAWSDDGFLVEITTSGVAAGEPDDHLTRSYDRLSQHAVFYDGFSTAVVSQSPATINLQSLIPEFLGHVGVFPMRTQSGFANLKNDPLEMLASSRASIVDGTVAVNGVECVVVELARTDEPSAPALLRGHYAPSLGYAQILLQTLRADGAVGSQWETHSWIDRGEWIVALPLSGTFQEFGANGASVREIHFDVVEDAAGAPLLHTGVNPSFVVELPVGTEIINKDNGETTFVAAREATAEVAMVSTRGSDTQAFSNDRRLLSRGGVIAVSMAVLLIGVCVLTGQRIARLGSSRSVQT